MTQKLNYTNRPQSQANDVKNVQNLVSRLTLDEVSGHEQQLKTIANGDVKILTDDKHQFKRTLKILGYRISQISIERIKKIASCISWITSKNRIM